MNADRSFYSLIAVSLAAHVAAATVFRATDQPARPEPIVLDIALVEPEPAPATPEPEPVLPEPVLPEEVVVPEPEPEPVVIEEPVTVPEVAPIVETTVIVEARPDYLQNPPPKYPAVARRNGWEGRALLRVKVLSDGAPASVETLQSSGYRLLDEAAMDAVRGWRFLPARRGEERLESWVEVPVEFRLRRGIS